ncbi:MAG: phospholipase D family protein [Chitinophagaceae bacterium]|nr:phospholipase D family protein [Chitinophagaceae bacterium]
MNIKFIGQGLDPESDITAGNFIIDSFESENYSSFNAFVAFVSTGGLKNIIDEMLAFKEAGGEVKLYLGVNLNATSKEALEKLLENEIESYVVYSPNNIIYHPKIYAFEGNETTRAIIGSSNLTESGLFQNIEASICVDFESNDENGNEFLADIYDHFNAIINQEHPSCQLLTQEVLEILIESNVVLPEAASRAKSNKINKEFGQKETKVNTRLLELFGKVKAKRPPKGFRKTVVKKELIAEEETNEVNVVDETTELAAGSMWIETGLMTGGSRNILDLSKKGKLDGVNKFGSVSYFGLDPENTNDTKDINVIFGGKTYISNHVFYAEGNSNWRIRLNGTTADGEKITIFSKPSLGENGGFQNKILLFTRVDDTDFRLEILEQDEMQRLIENSSDWAKGGSGNGRAYGIIAE